MNPVDLDIVKTLYKGDLLYCDSVLGECFRTLWSLCLYVVTMHILQFKLGTFKHTLFVCLCFQLAYRVASSLSDIVVETHRRKHLAYLMADQGAIVNPESAKNLPKQVSHCSCYHYC